MHPFCEVQPNKEKLVSGTDKEQEGLSRGIEHFLMRVGIDIRVSYRVVVQGQDITDIRLDALMATRACNQGTKGRFQLLRNTRYLHQGDSVRVPVHVHVMT